MRERLIRAMEGVAGGIAGTTVMLTGMTLSPYLPKEVRSPSVKKDPGEFMVDKAEEWIGRDLPGPLHTLAAQALHWSYGISFATALALAGGPSLKRVGRAALAGAAMGTGVWAIGWLGWLPAVGLAKPPRKQGKLNVASALGHHLAYGVLAGLTISLLDRTRAPLERASSVR
jgi:hypothetical protein